MKNNKGITLITLVTTILVIMIIFSIVLKTGFSASRQGKYYNAISQMRAMQALVNEIYEEYSNGDETKKEEIENYGYDIAEIKKTEETKKAFDEVKKNNITGENIGDLEDYRYYSVSYIKNKLDTEGISYDFMVNIKTRTAILVEGVGKEGNNGKKYYALCEIENQQYNVDYKENNTQDNNTEENNTEGDNTEGDNAEGDNAEGNNNQENDSEENENQEG